MRPFGRAPAPGRPPRLSTGIAGLDHALGGGIAPGSLTIVRPAGAARTADYRAWAIPPLRAALGAGYGALVTVSPDEDAAAVWAEIARRARGLDPEGRVRIVDDAADVPRGPWHVPLHPQLSPHVAAPRRAHAEEAAQGPGGGPILELWCFDALERLVGALDAARVARSRAGELRANGHWAVLWASHDGPVVDAARPAAGVELARDGGGLSVRGVRPSFPAIFVAP